MAIFLAIILLLCLWQLFRMGGLINNIDGKLSDMADIKKKLDEIIDKEDHCSSTLTDIKDATEDIKDVAEDIKKIVGKINDKDIPNSFTSNSYSSQSTDKLRKISQQNKQLHAAQEKDYQTHSTSEKVREYLSHHPQRSNQK